MAEKCNRGVINDCVYGTVVVTYGESENLTNFGFFELELFCALKRQSFSHYVETCLVRYEDIQ